MNDNKSFETQIDELVNENMIFRYATELEYTEDEKRKIELHDKIKTLDKNYVKQEQVTKLHTFFDKIDENQLHKSWSKLSTNLKKNRIKLFVGTDKELEEKYISMLDDNLLKPKYVDYDNEKCVINSITIKTISKKLKK